MRSESEDATGAPLTLEERNKGANQMMISQERMIEMNETSVVFVKRIIMSVVYAACSSRAQ